MAEDEDVDIIKKAEKEKREIGIAEQNPHITGPAQIHNICLSCGHRKDEHSPDGSRCHKAYCPCLRFKTTFLQYGSGP